MTTQEAINAVYNGNHVDCTEQEYKDNIRSALQDQAGIWADQNQTVRVIIALEEVKRLDREFSYELA